MQVSEVRLSSATKSNEVHLKVSHLHAANLALHSGFSMFQKRYKATSNGDVK